MEAVSFIIQGLRILILVDVVLSWLQRDERRFPRNLTHAITAPLYAPFHALLPPRRTGGLDLAPLLLLVVLSLIQRSL